MKNSSKISWFLLNVWFFLFMTRTEFPSMGTFAGLSYAMRGACGFLLIVQLLYFHRTGFRLSSLVTAIMITLLFLCGNLIEPSPLAVITGFGIFVGLVIGGLPHNPEMREIFRRLVRTYVFVNLLGLGLALVTYYGAGLEIDFHGMMFPWSAARVREFMGFYRVTGFQIEPGTYTATMYFCALLMAILRRRLFGRLEALAIISTMTTMSAWAALAIVSYFSGCIIEALLDRRRTGHLLKIAAVTVAIIPIVIMANPKGLGDLAYVQYFLDRFTTDDASGSMVMKLQAWDAWMSHFGTEMLLPHPLGQSFCPDCASPQDLGTLLNLIWFMGLFVSVPLLVWLSIMALRQRGPALLIASLPLIAAKFYFFDPSLWFYFGLLLFVPVMKSSAMETRVINSQSERRIA